MSQHRLDYLDVAKGIGIMLVVMGHANLGTPSWLFWLTNAFHMPLFFIISGMLIAYKKEQEKPFTTTCIRKCKQLLTPYLLFSGLNILLVLKELLLDLSNRGYIGVLLVRLIQTCTFSGISVLWFLPSLLFGELLLLLLLKGLHNKSTRMKTLVITSILALIIISLYFINPTRDEFDVNGQWILYIFENFLETCIHVIIALCFLMIGYCMQLFLAKMAPKIKYSFLSVASLLALSKVCSIFISPLNQIEDINGLKLENPIFFVLNGVVGTIFILCVAYLLVYLPIVKPALQYCGKNSLIILVTHLDCYGIYIAYKVATLLTSQLHIEAQSTMLILFTIALILVECFYITLMNRWFPFILGDYTLGQHKLRKGTQ